FNFRKPLLQAIMADSKKETLKHLNAYLAGWYEGNRKIQGGDGIIDSHLDQDPEWGGYYGYWSFESAAVAYLKDIDDTELRQYLYYPKDMVDWAREQRRIKQSEERDNRLPLLLPKGATAPFAGKYGIDNFIGHEIMVEQGERLPAGRVSAQYDENGEPLYRDDTVWRLLQREDGGHVRFDEEELKRLKK
ncbi:PoNe immunity protein domain-containing protein, partial [Neisseria sp. 74A18]|uniref:PoNe immunity protein domain-containing protein n=1 Tax=Neisseria sp. 74A18 TaxID=1696094 RepID=UPI000A9D82EF